MFKNKDDYGHCHHRHPLSHNVRAGFAIFVVDIKGRWKREKWGVGKKSNVR